MCVILTSLWKLVIHVGNVVKIEMLPKIGEGVARSLNVES